MTYVSPNCISFWLPRINGRVPTPRTHILTPAFPLGMLFDHGVRPPGFDDYLRCIRWCCEDFGYPCFLRCGQGSGKHDWEDCCWIESPDQIERKVCATVYDQGMKDLEVDCVAIRERIETVPIFRAFRGFPVTREFRLFVRGSLLPTFRPDRIRAEDKDVKDFSLAGHFPMPEFDGPAISVYHVQPYWPAAAVEGHTQEGGYWRDRLAEISTLSPGEYRKLCLMAGSALLGFDFVEEHDWSMDFLQDVSGAWWLTDMATARSSYRWDPDFPVVAGGNSL